MDTTITKAAHQEQLPWIDNGCVIIFQLADVGFLVEFVFSDVVLTAFMALFEKFYFTYLESFATPMRNTMIERIAKARVYFHVYLSLDF